MASSGVHIADMWVGLAGLPGAFADGGTAYDFPVVRARDARGNVRNWALRVRVERGGAPAPFDSASVLAQPVPDLPGHRGVITTETWHDGGDRHGGKTPTYVVRGKNAGKRNATNVATQALRDALGLYNKQLRAAGRPGEGSALVSSAEGAALVSAAEGAAAAPAGPPAFDLSSRPLPMLVKKPGDSADACLSDAVFRAGVTVQRKLNGVRLVVKAGEDGAPVFYSRKGGDYPGLAAGDMRRLLDAAPAAWARLVAARGTDPWAVATDPKKPRVLVVGASGARPPGGCPPVYLDGELYEHGKSLRWISGQARGSAGGESLAFWVFDCFFPALTAAGCPVVSSTRQQFLDLLFAEAARGGPLAHARRVENFAADSEARARALAKEFVRDGYEGAIVRKNDKPYRYGTKNYHSSNLLKVKPLLDSEFAVVGYTQGEIGKDLGAVIWTCEVPAADSPTGVAERFNVVPKNTTYALRYRIYECLGLPAAAGSPQTRFERDFAGRLLTVEYPELSSKTGKPTQAKALGFRPAEPAPGDAVAEDPVTRLLRECA